MYEEEIKDELQFVVYPKFKPLYFFIAPTLFDLGCFIILLAVWCIIFLNIGKEPEFIPTISITFFCYIIYLIFKVIMKKKEYKDIKYEFYKTQAKNYKSFLTIKGMEDIEYAEVRMCKLKRTLLDRIFGVGRIQIFLRNSEYHGMLPICFPFIENYNEVYEEFVKLLDYSKQEDNISRYEIKPKFAWGYQALKFIVIGIILFVISKVYIDIYFEHSEQFSRAAKEHEMTYLEFSKYVEQFPEAYIEFNNVEQIYLGVIFFMILIGIIILYLQKLRFNETTYNFLKTKVRVTSKFSIEELRYTDITDIYPTQNILEKLFKTGKIKLYTDRPIVFRGKHGHRLGYEVAKETVGINLKFTTNAKEKCEEICNKIIKK